MDVKSITGDRGAGGAEAFFFLFLAAVVITPTKGVKFVYDVLIYDCNQQPCSDGLEK